MVVDGESDKNARPLDREWVLDIRNQCVRKVVDFEFRQRGTRFIKGGVMYSLQTRELCKQARSRRNQLQTLKFRRFAQFPSLCTICKTKLLIMSTAFKVLVIIDKGDL